MRDEVMSRVALDLMSTPPLIFRLIRRKLNSSARTETNPGLRLPHLEIMRILRDEGSMHAAEIGDKLIIAKAQMTHLIDKLARMGLVQRKICPTDRRTVDISITAKGKTFMNNQDMLVLNAVRDILSALSEEEMEKFYGSLQNLRDVLVKME